MLFQKGIDVIFCCNVLIYFDLASKRRVVQHFYANLLPGGYLFLGHAESLFQVDDSFRLVHFHGNHGVLQTHVSEQQILGYTHADSGSLLCEHWGFSQDLSDAARWHHEADLLPDSSPLVYMVHLGDLLCRVRNLGYGYDEIMAVAFAQDFAWGHLVTSYPALAKVDLVRFTLDLDGTMEHIAALVDSVFAPAKAHGSPH
jgi:hypothetical protein